MSAPPRNVRRVRMRTGVVQFAAFVVVLGIPDGALGVLWPQMRQSFGRPLGDLGYLVVAGTLLYALGGVVFSGVASRMALRQVVLWSCVLGAATAALWAGAPEWAVALLALGLFGLARGVLDAAVNAGAAGGVRMLGWLHAGWAVGGALGPLLVTALAGAGSWRWPVGVIAVAAAVVSVAAALSAPAWQVAPPQAGDAVGPEQRRPWVRTAIVATFFVYTAAEIGPVAWGYVYLTDHRGMGTRAAAVSVAMFWVLLTVGRVGLGVSGRSTAGVRLVVSCSVLAAVSLAALWLAPLWLAVIGLGLAGLAFAPVFPLLVNLTAQHVGTAASDHTIGLAIAAGAVGGPLAVLVEGRLVDHLGASSLGPGLAVVALFAAAVVTLTFSSARDRPDRSMGIAR